MKAANQQSITSRMNRQPILAVFVLILAVFSTQLSAQSAPTQFVPFPNFVAASAAATASDYQGRPESRVRDAAAFEEMRQHILTMYQGVQVSHSFVLASDYIDCVPIEQQPSVRLSSDKAIAVPPPQEVSDPGRSNTAAVPDYAGQLDPFGNTMQCEDGTIPMLRMTLEQMTRFATLSDFLQKGPDGLGQLPGGDGELQAEAEHKYAHADQTINNWGGGSALNVWSPNVDTANNQIFSLSQMWFSGGDRNDPANPLQTVEGGWQNYPAFYGDQQSRLFIFWTSNNYKKGSGCYNLTCKGFKQVNNSWSLGTAPGWIFGKGSPPPPFDHYSQHGGAQYEFTMRWYLFNGNWWLGLGTTGNLTWIGYYPGTLFNGGQMSRNGTDIDFGGETAGVGNWGPMGSGDWPNQGFGNAAFQRRVVYRDTTGRLRKPTLTKHEPSPTCYLLSGPSFVADAEWATYFYFGGPGGNACE